MTVSRTDAQVVDDTEPVELSPDEADIEIYYIDLEIARRKALRDLKYRQLTREMKRRGLLPESE